MPKAINLIAFGETKSKRAWIKDKRCKIACHKLLNKRLAAGWSHQEAISTKTVRKDISGERHWRLTAVRRSRKRNRNGRRGYWVFRCDCGKTIHSVPANVRKGKVKSCGCLYRDKGLMPGEAGCNEVFGAYKRSARHREIAWKLTKDEFLALVQNNCYYCGVPPCRVFQIKSSTEFVCNGIDRVNNDLGYVLSNCVSCCKICNYAKRSMSISEFLEWIKRVYIFAFRKEMNSETKTNS